MKEKIEKKVETFEGQKISRKEAIKKAGLMAASAATMMVLLKTPKAQASSSRGFKKSGSVCPPVKNPGRKSGPWKNKNGHKNQNGNGHTFRNGNGHNND